MKRTILILIACSSVLLAGCAEYKPNEYVVCSGQRGHVKAESKNRIYIEEHTGHGTLWGWMPKSSCEKLDIPPNLLWSVSGADKKIIDKGFVDKK